MTDPHNDDQDPIGPSVADAVIKGIQQLHNQGTNYQSQTTDEPPRRDV